MRVHDCLMMAMKCFELCDWTLWTYHSWGTLECILPFKIRGSPLTPRQEGTQSTHLISPSLHRFRRSQCDAMRSQIERILEMLRFSKILEDSRRFSESKKILLKDLFSKRRNSEFSFCVLVSGPSLGDWPSFKVSPPMSHTICLALTPARLSARQCLVWCKK